MTRRTSRVARLVVTAACVVALGSASEVGAGALRFDLNGTWTGTIKCKSSKAGAKSKITLAPTMKIEQSGLEVGVELVLSTGNQFYTGVANPDAKKPFDRGEVALVSCTTNDSVGDDFSFDEIGRMVVKATRGDVKGSFKGTSLFTRPGSLQNAEAGTCKWSFKRTADDFPSVPVTCLFGATKP